MQPKFLTFIVLTAMALAGCKENGTQSPSNKQELPQKAEAPAKQTENNASENQTSFTATHEPSASYLNTRPDTRSKWTEVFTGYGSIVEEPEKQLVTLAPAAATESGKTHAALATFADGIPNTAKFVRIESDVTTWQQLRQNTPPNAWETAWLLFNFNNASTATAAEDDNNDYTFYAVALKTNGIEVSKQDPNYKGGQRFISTSGTPKFVLGKTYRVRIDLEKTDSEITGKVYVDGALAITFEDKDKPYLSGKIAAYTEDAKVSFANTRVKASNSVLP